jgi:hypothetical protein
MINGCMTRGTAICIPSKADSTYSSMVQGFLYWDRAKSARKKKWYGTYLTGQNTVAYVDAVQNQGTYPTQNFPFFLLLLHNRVKLRVTLECYFWKSSSLEKWCTTRSFLTNQYLLYLVGMCAISRI